MQLLQLFLPIYDREGRPFPKAMFDAVRAELAERHGGVTAYLRSPAVGCAAYTMSGVFGSKIRIFLQMSIASAQTRGL